MKTVGEFKNVGLIFVKGDHTIESDGSSSKGDIDFNTDLCFNKYTNFDSSPILEFAWRENTGVKPEFSGHKELELKNGEIKLTSTFVAEDNEDWSITGDGTDIIKWRPSLNQPSVAEHDSKESEIHKAWVALGGSIRHDFQDANLIWHVSGANYVNGEYYFSSGDSCFESGAKLICTVKEFTDYCEKMAAEEKRMDIIGQNGNDGLHYDNTAQQVESLAVNAQRPIFTRVMADANELPPIGSFVDVVGKNGVELFYGEGEVNCEVLAHVENTAVIKMGYGLGCFSSDALKASDTRTDREKAIDDALALDEYRDGLGMMSRKDFVGKLYDNGLLKC